MVKVVCREAFHVNLREPVQERLWQAFPSPSLVHRILSRENLESRRAIEGLVQLWNENFSAVIKQGIQSFENTLLRKIQLVQKDPATIFDRQQQWTILPLEKGSVVLARIARALGSEKIHHVRVLTQVDSPTPGLPSSNRALGICIALKMRHKFFIAVGVVML